MGSDESIPSASTGFDSYATGGEGSGSLWLVIEISYTGTCTSASNDPCEALVDELARIGFDNYADVEELTGIRINITNYSSFGPIDFSYTPIEKALTIEEWRRELSIHPPPRILDVTTPSPDNPDSQLSPEPGGYCSCPQVSKANLDGVPNGQGTCVTGQAIEVESTTFLTGDTEWIFYLRGARPEESFAATVHAPRPVGLVDNAHVGVFATVLSVAQDGRTKMFPILELSQSSHVAICP